MPASRPAARVARLTSLRAYTALALFLLISVIATVAAHAQDNGKKPAPTEAPATQTDTDIDEDMEEGPVPTPQPTPAVPAKSVVKGRVIYDDTNRPVRRARVMLLKSDNRSGMEKTGATDERGEFRIKDVAAGSYIVLVDAPGIVSPFSNVELEEGMNERNALVALKKEVEEVTVNGTNTVDVQVRARRGGAVTGRVTYADGDPAIGAQIIIMRKKDNRITRFLPGISPFAMLGLRTDDRGIYRIAGLPPGEYILGAAESNTRDDVREEYAMMGGLFGGTNFSVTYYQNETSAKQARPVKIEGGQETNEINITLLERATYTVAGTVVARQGRTPLRARLSIQSATDATATGAIDFAPNTDTDEQGRWSFSNIPDGTYVIKAEPTWNGPSDDEDVDEDGEPGRSGRTATTTTTAQKPAQPSYVGREQQVTVAGGDMTNVVIELGEGGSLQGTVTFEGNEKDTSRVFYLVLTPREGGAPIERYAPTDESGKFFVNKIPPGEFYISAQRMADRFYVKSITAGGTDLLREPVRITSGRGVENIRVVIASDVATLQGRVTSASDSKPVRGALVLLVPADPTHWRTLGSYIPGVTQAEGVYKITAPPGSYLLMPLAEGETLRSVNEAFIRARSATAKSVTLQPNGSETVDLVAPAGSP